MSGLNNKSLKLMHIMSVLTMSGKFIGKGGNIVILNTINKTKMFRLSEDVDVTCIEYNMTDYKVLEIIKSLFKRSSVYITRASKDGTSLQITVDDTPIDIEINRGIKPDCQKYYINNEEIIAVDIYSLLADKLAVISSRKIFRRCKDLIDIYNIITNYQIKSETLVDAFKKNKRELDYFKEFNLNIVEIKAAFDKIELKDNDAIKEDFYIIHDTISKFISGIDTYKIWDNTKYVWVDKQENLNPIDEMKNLSNRV